MRQYDTQHMGGLWATSRTGLTVAEMNAGSTNAVKGKVQPRKDAKFKTGGKGKGVQEKAASPAMSLNKADSDNYLGSGELAFPANDQMYDYLRRDEGSDEQKDVDQGFDEVKVRDHRVDYTAKRY